MINLAFKQQVKRTIFFTIILILLNGCVQQPVFKTENYALFTSGYPIVRMNGIDIEATYNLDLEAGENSLVVVYSTYQHDYFCTFSWVAIAGTAYEVTNHENQYPLTLYRWHRRNGLWVTRLDPMDPLECDQKPK